MNLIAFSMPGGWEWVLILLIGLLLFGRRLPEVGRSLGKSIVEFKKGIKGIEDEIESASGQSSSSKESSRPQLSAEGGQGGPATLETDPRAVSTRDKVE